MFCLFFFFFVFFVLFFFFVCFFVGFWLGVYSRQDTVDSGRSSLLNQKNGFVKIFTLIGGGCIPTTTSAYHE